MIIAVEINKTEWDFFCPTKWEFNKALKIVGKKLKANLDIYSKSSFRASFLDIELVKYALSEYGIDLYYENEKETILSFDNDTENTHKLPVASSGNYSDTLRMAANVI